jgi:ribosome maturation factor RimP
MEGVLKSAIAEKIKEEEWQDCFLIDIVTNGTKIQVFLDADEALTFRRCQKMSRHLEPILDEANYLGGKYILEVSSPGVDRPLKLLRQYVKNIGRNIQFDLKNQETVTGKLIAVNGEDFIIEMIDPKDKKKKAKINKELKLEEVKRALVQISFK